MCPIARITYIVLLVWSMVGNYLYIPNHTTCCPQYILRLHTQAFKLSRSQRKTIRRAESIVPKFANVDGSAETTSNTAQAVNIPAVSFTPTSSSSLSIPKPGLSITIERAEYTQEKYLLYSTYMQHIHNKSTSTASSFCDFLVVSPLVSPHNDAYGTFHMCYRLVSGGSLVAVSVLDFLPSGMISVYCFYDPTYKEYALGTYLHFMHFSCFLVLIMLLAQPYLAILKVSILPCLPQMPLHFTVLL
ncbi:hypothetical protein EON65_23865 [archaeon]|nr:MAG: hypothetical protein EON65_23865 [archaeon]